MTDPDFDKVTAPVASEPARLPPVVGYGTGPQNVPFERSIDVKDFLKIIFKRRWIVLSAFFIVSIATAVETYSSVPTYGASAKLLIEVAVPKYVQFDDVNSDGGDPNSVGYLETQYQLLKSRSLARKTLDALKLWDNMPPKNTPASFSLVEFAMRPVGWVRGFVMRPVRWVAGSFRKETVPVASRPDPLEGAQGELETVAQSRAIDAVLGMLAVTPVGDTRLVMLTARSFDPRLATAVANAHAKGFIEQNTEFKFQSSVDAAKWLNDRLAEQRKDVDTAEKALQAYRESHATIPAEDSQNITVQKLSQLSAAYTAARLARLEKEVVFNQLEAIGDSEAGLAAFPAILSNPTIQAQKTELTGLKRNEDELLQTLDINHPKVKTVRTSIDSAQAKIQTEVQNVVKAIRTDFEASKAQEKNLADALQAQKDETLTMSQEGIQFGILKREVDSSREIFQSLMQSAKETGISTQERTTNVRIVDPAEVPRSPTNASRSSSMMMGVFGGLFLGLVLAFFFEYFDDRIKNPDELKAYLGVPVLGLLPAVKALETHNPPTLNGGGSAQMNEAFRTLRTNVIFSSAEQGCRSLVVTSTGPNEGKTMVTANFAMSLAEAGLRVLVIDADMRRPQQHKVFDVEQEPGLSNLIVGGVKPSEAIRKTSVPGLWVLPAGRIPPNPAELLGSPRFLEFFKSLSEHFDWLIIDTPPVLAVADASTVAHAVTGVLFVVRAEMVSRGAAQSAVEQLDRTRANIIGAVLNRVELDKHSYYYSHYYRKEYADYYATAPKA